MKKKLTAVLLSILVIVQMLPLFALAEETETPTAPFITLELPEESAEQDEPTGVEAKPSESELTPVPCRVYTGTPGSFTTEYCDEYTLVDETTTELASGWYVVARDVTIEKQIVLTGDAHLILCDNCTLDAKQGIFGQFKALSIYAQSDVSGIMGRLFAQGADYFPGIGGKYVEITIHGGEISAYGGSYSAGIGSGGGISDIHESKGLSNITINGGLITAVGSVEGAGIGTGLDVSCWGVDITFNGGIVSASGYSALGNGYVSYNDIPVRVGDGVDIINLDTGMQIFPPDGDDWQGKLGGSDIAFVAKVSGATAQPVTYQRYDAESNLLAEDIITDYQWFYSSNTSLTDGVYVVYGTPYVQSLDINGDVTLILANSGDLRVKDCVLVTDGCSLTICGQSEGEHAGRLTVENQYIWAYSVPGITGDGNVTINSGSVSTVGFSVNGDVIIRGGSVKSESSPTGLPGIRGGNVMIRGGSVMAIGDIHAAGITGDNITISGGTVTAFGGSDNGHNSGRGYNGGAGITGGNITISGGTVTATGGAAAAGIGGGYRASCGNVTISGGSVTATGGSDRDSNGGAGIGGGAGSNGGNVTISGGTVVASGGGYQDLTNYVAARGIGGGGADYHCDDGTLTIGENVESLIDNFTGNPIVLADGQNWYETDGLKGRFVNFTAISTVTPPSEPQEIGKGTYVSYLVYDTEDGLFRSEKKAVPFDNFLDSTKTAWTDGNYYVADGTVDLGAVTVTGDVKLILKDGCDLTVSEGIAIDYGNSLTVYAQSDGEKAGSLTSVGVNGGAGIGGDGKIIIHGGNIKATGSEAYYDYDGSAGIGSDAYSSRGCDVTIYGGTVEAQGAEGGAGIGSGYYEVGYDYDFDWNEFNGFYDNGTAGKIAIYGGKITAVGGYNAAGIGGGYGCDGGNIGIYGGYVNAEGGATSGITTSEYVDGIGSGWFDVLDEDYWEIVYSDEVSGGTRTLDGGVILSNGTEILHEHIFTGEYRDNENGTHSRKCLYCDEYGNSEEHTFTSGIYRDNNDGTHSQKCLLCECYGNTEQHTIDEYKDNGDGTYTPICRYCRNNGASLTSIAWTSASSLPTVSCRYHLENDVTLSEPWNIPWRTTIILDLNGHTITRSLTEAAADGYVIGVSGKLTILDSSENKTGTVTGGNNTGNGGGIYVFSDGYFALESGSISGNTTAANGGGVYSLGTTVMTGGKIENNLAGSQAGGLQIDAGTANLKNVSVSGNSAYGSGGIYLGENASLTLTDCSVDNNTVSNGTGGIYSIGTLTATGCSISGNKANGGHVGAFYSNKGTASFTDCEIKNNECKNNGGAFYIDGSASVTMNNCTVSGNKAGSNAGAMYIRLTSPTVTLTDCHIDNNTAGSGTGAIYSSGKLTVTGGSISGNEAKNGNVGGVYTNSGTAAFTDCEIKNNKCTRTGGGFYVDGTSTVTIDGCTLSGNSAKTTGGAIHLQNGSLILKGSVSAYDNTVGSTVNNVRTKADSTGTISVSDMSAGSKVGIDEAVLNVITGITGTNVNGLFMDNGDHIAMEDGGYASHTPDYTDSYVDNGDGTHSGKCVCGIISTEKTAHTFTDGVCVCGAEEAAYLYYDEEIGAFNTGVRYGCEVIDENNKPTDWKVPAGSTEKWYVVKGNVSISGRPVVTGSVHLILTDGCELTIYDGINVADGNSLTVYGQVKGTGILDADKEDDLYEDYDAGIGGDDGQMGGTVCIHGGVVKATGDFGAGIGGGSDGDGGTVKVFGGSVTAQSREGAGIGGGSGGDGGTVKVFGGSVTATGKNGAGIGGGFRGDGGDVTINGGEVSARSWNNAGIGGSEDGDGGTVMISGGNVSAEGSYGAGIGGGNGGDGGTVTISGGTVTVISMSGAGIGGGDGGDGGTVTISGGEVSAGSGEGAGIGGDGGTVTISGGEVSAESWSGAGIGGDGGEMTISDCTVSAASWSGMGIGVGSDGNLTITDGIVTATSEEGAGIVGGTVEISDSDVTVTSGADGIRGDVTINGGTVTVTSLGGMGIVGGKVDISDSDVTVTSGKDGISGDVTISGGIVNVTNYDGAGIGDSEPFSDVSVIISGGEVTVTSTGMCISGNTVIITGGSLSLSGTGIVSGNVDISDGKVTVSSGGIAIVGGKVNISGGEVTVTSGADGISGNVTISGGIVNVTSSGDGIYGGRLEFIGGEVTVICTDRFRAGIFSSDAIVIIGGSLTAISPHVCINGNMVCISGGIVTASSSESRDIISGTVEIFDNMAVYDIDGNLVSYDADMSYLKIVDKSAPDGPAILNKTSIRTSGTPGLRFAAYVTDAQRKACTSYGFLVARETADLKTAPTLLVFNGAHSASGTNPFGVTYTSGEAYNKANGIDKIYAEDGEAFGLDDVEATFFTGVMQGIPEAFYAENLIARPYMVVKGVTLYGETYAKSLYANACAIRDGGYQGLDEDGIKYINSIISAVDNEAEIDVGGLTE